MRTSLMVASLFSMLAAPPSWALEWVGIDAKSAASDDKLLSDSAYVDKATGLIHVVICTGGTGCPDANGGGLMNDVRATDAVIDCAKRTITWRDTFEGVNVATVASSERVARSQAAHRDPFERSRRIEITPQPLLRGAATLAALTTKAMATPRCRSRVRGASS